MNVKHEPLTLIPPNFETPLPPLTPAVFPPSLPEPPEPALELFDLDEQFASEKVRLAHLTDKCKDSTTIEDLEYYVKMSGEILGVNQKLKPEELSAKKILEYVFKQITQFKKVNYDSYGQGKKGITTPTSTVSNEV